MHKNTQYASRTRGFTFLEMLLTMLILVMVFFPLVQVLSRALLVGGETENTNLALGLARDKLETIKNTSFTSIANESKAPIPGSDLFQSEVIVTSPHSKLKDVEIIIYWQSADGSELNISLKSLISSYIRI